MVCAGSDIVSEDTVEAFRSAGLYGSEPTGEAAAAVVLETESSARARGARIYARLNGYAIKSDAVLSDGQLPNSDALARAIYDVLHKEGQRTLETVWGNCNADDRQRLEELISNERAACAEELNYKSIREQFGQTNGAEAALTLAGAALTLKQQKEPTLRRRCAVVNARSGSGAVSIVLEEAEQRHNVHNEDHLREGVR
ncbi:hypothetical protein PCURB6_25000 [Paenibacillus curdlanolyticus]|nr:hypothetical protein PCURB6_25000 [Paenibacillus curdlanolyticus]